MFLRPRKRSEAPAPFMEQVDEFLARKALYGADTRSGRVSVYGPISGVILIAQDMVNPGLFRDCEPWMKWDTIRWDWPVYGEISGARHGCDF